MLKSILSCCIACTCIYAYLLPMYLVAFVFDQFLESIDDKHKAIFINARDVTCQTRHTSHRSTLIFQATCTCTIISQVLATRTGVEPALLIHAFSRGVRSLVVALHNVVASTPELALLVHTAVAPSVYVDDAHFHARYEHTRRAVGCAPIRRRHQHAGRRLGQPVAYNTRLRQQPRNMLCTCTYMQSR